MKTEIITKPETFSSKFVDCCQHYNQLEIAVAWCGDPNKTLPYEHLDSFRGNIMATIGTSFSHTHPEAIQWLKDLKADIRIFRNEGDLFHPKVYLFSKGDQYSLFIGSSNLTYGGFYLNIEINVFIEGKYSENDSIDIGALQSQLNEWRTDRFTFKPSSAWLNEYRKEYALVSKKARKHGIRTETRLEEELGNASWLQIAEWNIFYSKVLKGLRHLENEFILEESSFDHSSRVLDASSHLLSVPWKVTYFADIEKRRIINGIGHYGWLGHVGASGMFQHLIANGKLTQYRTIVRCINNISSMNPPIPWDRFKSALHDLLNLGPTMKVWGRLITLTRPDLFCTVSSNSVRANLSKTLNVPADRFVGVDGYTQLIKLIHASPWFNSSKPTKEKEAIIWNRRAAYMDAIFY